MRRGLEWTGWGVLALLAAGIGGFSLRYALPHVPMVHITNFFTRRPWLVTHALASSVALLTGVWQFLPLGTRRRGAVHRWLGRVYLVAVLVGWVASVPIAAHAETGAVASAGFLLLGVVWVGTSAVAYVTIRRGQVEAHRQWMIRSYALTAAAISLRLILPAEMATGIPFPIAYPVVAWACWLVNIAAAEWWIRRTARSRVPTAAVPQLIPR